MALVSFDHVNIRTSNLDLMRKWYVEVLGLTDGERPPFPFPGAWLYLGDRAVVHLIGTGKADMAGDNLNLEHFAFSAEGFAEFRDHLSSRKIGHRVNPVPGLPIVQVDFKDPDGNHLHVDFNASEAGTL